MKNIQDVLRNTPTKVSTGIISLDEIVGGGLARERTTLLMGGHRFRPDYTSAADFAWKLRRLRRRNSFLDAQTTAMGTRRIVFGALAVVLALLRDAAAIRRTIYLLHEWLLARKLPGLVTAKTGQTAILHSIHIQLQVREGLSATRTIRRMEGTRSTAVDVPAAGTPIVALAPKYTPLSLIEQYGVTERNTVGPVTRSPQPILVKMPRGLEEITPGYLASRRGDLTEMRAFLAASDFKAMAVLAHNMKGSGSSFGFPELTRMGTALEQSAKQTDSATLRAQLTELKDYLCRVELAAA